MGQAGLSPLNHHQLGRGDNHENYGVSASWSATYLLRCLDRVAKLVCLLERSSVEKTDVKLGANLRWGMLSIRILASGQLFGSAILVDCFFLSTGDVFLALRTQLSGQRQAHAY